MSIEALWYQDHTEDGHEPTCRRLSRLPIEIAFEAAIDLAIDYARGRAGYRSVGRNTVTGEVTWWAPDFQPPARSATSAKSEWWMIPGRVDRRALALYSAAIECEIRRTQGTAEAVDIVRRLRRWKRSGHWRRIASGIAPKTVVIAPKKRTRRKRAAK